MTSDAPGGGREMTAEAPIQVGDYVRIKAGGDPMLVVAVAGTCDGTSLDGPGLYCAWLESRDITYGWISDSSVVLTDDRPEWPPQPAFYGSVPS